MEKLKKFIDLYIPIEACNLRCSYCYVTLKRKFANKIPPLLRTEQEIKKAFSTERLGGKCLINFCADGETLLSQDVLKIIKALLEEGHYLMVVTNGTLTERFKEMSTWNLALLKRLFFKFSFHYLQLLGQKKTDIFFNNIKTIERVGCSYTVEMVPHDELIPHIEDIKKLCMEKLGALCHVTIARDPRTKDLKILTKYSPEEYKKIWETFNSELFKFKAEIFGQKRKEFCYAGNWSLVINAYTGEIQQCYGAQIIGNIYELNKPIKPKPIGRCCTQPHCYNGHAFLSLGVIPELNTPSFTTMRNRETVFGTTWLSDEFKNFILQKLRNHNVEYSEEAQMRYYRSKNLATIRNYTSRAINKFKKIFFGQKK